VADSPAPAPRSRRRVSPATTTPCPYGATPARARRASLAKPPRVTRAACTAAPSTARLVDAQLSTRLAVLPCTSGTWCPTALSSAVTAFRCLDGYDRHKEPPTPFGGRAASSSQLFSRASVARGARALCRRLVETPSSKHLSGLPPTQHPPQPKLVHVVRGLAGPGSIGIGRGARGASFPCGALGLHVQM
jgi:hypothetical protein